MTAVTVANHRLLRRDGLPERKTLRFAFSTAVHFTATRAILDGQTALRSRFSVF